MGPATAKPGSKVTVRGFTSSTVNPKSCTRTRKTPEKSPGLSFTDERRRSERLSSNLEVLVLCLGLKFKLRKLNDQKSERLKRKLPLKRPRLKRRNKLPERRLPVLPPRNLLKRSTWVTRTSRPLKPELVVRGR